jgi:hypothetical protein
MKIKYHANNIHKLHSKFDEVKSIIHEESNLRSDSDIQLSKNIVEESTRAINVEDEILTTISDEIEARTNADASEKLERVAGDSALQTQINSILSNSDPLALEALTKILEDFKKNDSNLNGTIVSLSTAATSGISLEKSERIESYNELMNLLEESNTSKIKSDSELEKTMKEYSDLVATKGGSKPKKERVLVSDDKIKLTYAPINGEDGILNYGLVRCIEIVEGEMIVEDAEVELDKSDEEGKTFILSDIDGEWDNKKVLIQYLYCPESV